VFALQRYVFKDASKLSPRYIPKRLPHREKQIEKISGFIDPLSEYTTIVQIQGPAGSGKTSSAYHVGLRFTRQKPADKLKMVYINLKLETGTKFLFYKRILEKIEPAAVSRSLSAEELLYILLKILSEKDSKLILIIDEIDFYMKSSKDTSIIYDLTRLNEIELGGSCPILSILMISRDPVWKRKMDKAELSSLGRLIVNFPSYTQKQIYDILEYRASEALYSDAVSPEVLEFISEITIKEANGDIRYALDILYYSAVLAEQERLRIIDPELVREVLSQINPGITSEDIYSLTPHEKLVLLSLAYALKENRQAYTSFTNIIDYYKSICESKSIRTLSIKTLETCLQKLSDKGLIEFHGIKRIGISTIPLEKLIPTLDNLIKRLEEG